MAHVRTLQQGQILAYLCKREYDAALVRLALETHRAALLKLAKTDIEALAQHLILTPLPLKICHRFFKFVHQAYLPARLLHVCCNSLPLLSHIYDLRAYVL